jgi:Abortive infection C-terminus
MAQEIISKKTRNEFREFLVGSTLREIEMEFDAADIDCHPADGINLPTGERRSLVERYYASLDLTKYDDAKKLLTVYENILTRVSAHSQNGVTGLEKWLEKDGFVFRNGRIEQKTGVTLFPQMKQIAVEFSAEHMAEQIRRLESAVDSDPALAIGSAKELVETCCRTILRERGVVAERDWDVPRLIKETAKILKLTPDDVPDQAKGEETIRRVLGNLGSISQGLAELRNLYGTGHGKDGRAKGVSSRHARLAAGCAATLAIFLFETHKAGS